MNIETINKHFETLTSCWWKLDTKKNECSYKCLRIVDPQDDIQEKIHVYNVANTCNTYGDDHDSDNSFWLHFFHGCQLIVFDIVGQILFVMWRRLCFFFFFFIWCQYIVFQDYRNISNKDCRHLTRFVEFLIPFIRLKLIDKKELNPACRNFFGSAAFHQIDGWKMTQKIVRSAFYFPS